MNQIDFTNSQDAVHSESSTDKSRSNEILRRFFTTAGKAPFDQIEWEQRDVILQGSNGETVFEQKGVEAPKFWSEMATSIVASKYFHGDLKGPARESSVRQLIARVVDTVTAWGKQGRYFQSDEDCASFRDELTHILLHQYAAFNSPVWFNVGVREHPQCSACFIVSVDDSLDSILNLQTTEARLFKYGSGTGTNLSSLRSSKEKLSGGGKPSGPVSFMRAFDAWASVVKSGGKTRRAAKMQILNATHPDILEFISCKKKEEEKAWALIEQGYDGHFSAQGGAYDSVAFQNVNLSVRAGDDFMRAAETNQNYSTVTVAGQKRSQELNARDVLRLVSECTYVCGDPGLQFDDTINRWHTCPRSGRINASNPCSEYMHLDNSACNLASLNLLKFLREDGSFDTQAFSHSVRILIMAQDILIDNSSYPTHEIEKNAHKFRALGLGYANLGALLMNLGLPYDSDQGRALAAAVTSLMSAEAYKTSSLIAGQLGSFAGYKKNEHEMLKVLEMHRAQSLKLPLESLSNLQEDANLAWAEAVKLGKKHGLRNSQTTVLAPTGTISFMMDCDTTGVEPDIALVKYKKLVGGGYLKLVNQSVIRALKTLGYTAEERMAITEHIDRTGTIEGAPALKDQDLPVFDCALRPEAGSRFISYMGHLKMMAATQPFISGAISKTVNLPKDTNVDEIFEIYLNAWKMGIKAVALYRDGSKRTQPLNTSEQSETKDILPTPVRRRLPDERKAITHKFSVAGLEGYLTVGLYESGMPGEIFLVVAKEGSTLSGVMDAFATSVSIALQYGVPLVDLCRKFTHSRFEPAGFTKNTEIPMAKSVIDYVFKWLALRFLGQEERESVGLKDTKSPSLKSEPESAKMSGHKADSASLRPAFHNWEDAPPCTSCGSGMMVRQGGCYVCLNCGSQGGCG